MQWRAMLAVLALCVFSGTPFPAAGQVPVRQIETLQQQGRQAYAQGDPGAALQYYSLALQLASDSRAPADTQLFTTASNLAVLLAQLGRNGDAEAVYNRLIPKFEAEVGPDFPTSLSLKADYAQLLSETGRADAAIPIQKQVLAVRLRYLPADDPSVLRVQHELASSYGQIGRVDLAVPLFREIARTREATLGLGSEQTLTTYVNLAKLLDDIGEYDESDRIYWHIMPTMDAALGPAHELLYTVATNLAARLMTQGRTTEAVSLLRKSLQGREAVLPMTSPHVYTSRTLLANALLQNGEFDEALALHVMNVRLIATAYGDNSPAMIQALGNYAAALTAAGRTADSLVIHRDRLRIATAAFGLGSAETAVIMNDIAATHAELGQGVEATRMMQQAYRAMTKAVGADHPQAIRMQVSLSALLSDQHPRQALDMGEDAAARARRVFGPEHPLTIHAEFNRFQRRREAGLLTRSDVDALTNLLDVARRLQGPNSQMVRALEQGLVGALGSSTGAADKGQALALARTALASAILRMSRPRNESDPALATTTTDFRARAFDMAYLAYWADSQDRSRTLTHSERAALRDESFRAAQLQGFGPVGHAMRAATLRAAGARGGFADAVKNWERTLEDIDAMNVAYVEAVQTEDTEALGWMNDSIANLRAQQSQLETAIAEKLPGFFDLLTPRTVGVVDLLRGPAQLAEDEALILIAPAPPDQGANPPLLWVVTAEGSIVGRPVGIRTDQLNAAIQTFHASLSGTSGPGNATFRAPISPGDDTASGSRMRPVDLETGYWIYQALFGDPHIHDILSSHERIILVPQGSLLSLPFAALPMDRPGPDSGRTARGLREMRWLGVERALVIAPSVASVVEARRAAPASAAPRQLSYVGFGDPVFTGTGSRFRGIDASRMAGAEDRVKAVGGLPALPATAWEVSTVAGIFAPSRRQVFLGQDADETQFSALAAGGGLDGVSVLHFATHGLLAGTLSGLDEPALALSPPAAPAPLAAGMVDDGLLTASEIAAHYLNADWVILSACETAVGDPPDSEGLSGLAKAFFFAGAQSLMVTHWAVQDDAAARIIVATLQGWQSGLPKAEAHRRALATMIADRSRDQSALPFSHPSVWAPFELIGALD